MSNKERMQKYSKSYYRTHKEEVKKTKKIYVGNNREKINNYNRIHRQNNRELRLLYDYRSSDKKKNYICDLTVEWIKDNITSKPCTYCHRLVQVGCDRIDNTKGHTMDNCVPCCDVCNTTRMNNFTYEEMHVIGDLLANVIYPNRTEVD